MEIKEKATWGGKRANQTGRPKKAEGTRKQRQMRAFEDEWDMIKEFSKIIKYGNKEACKKFIEKHKINK